MYITYILVSSDVFLLGRDSHFCHLLDTSQERDRDALNQAIRDSQVLYTKDNRSWDWELVSTILKVSRLALSYT